MQEYRLIAPVYDFLLGPFVRSIRMKVLKVVRDLNPESVLDVACGTGDQLRLLKENNINVLGVDASEPMLNICRRKNPAADCLLQDARAMAFQDGSFDLAMISFALHEAGWNVALGMLEEIHRVLKPGGNLLIVDYSDFQRTPAHIRKTIHIIEFLAGSRHYKNFRDFLARRQSRLLVDKDRFHLLSTTHHASNSIVIQTYIKTEYI